MSEKSAEDLMFAVLFIVMAVMLWSVSNAALAADKMFHYGAGIGGAIVCALVGVQSAANFIRRNTRKGGDE